MELGHYGWNRKINIFQQHPVFITSPAESKQQYGVFNVGDGNFDGLGSSAFVGNVGGTIIATNTKVGFTGNLLHLQAGGLTQFELYYDSWAKFYGDLVVSNGVHSHDIFTHYIDIKGTPADGSSTMYLYNPSTGVDVLRITSSNTEPGPVISAINENYPLILANVARSSGVAVQVGGSTNWTIAPGCVPFAVVGIFGQTGDLQQWQNSDEDVLAKVDASGNITSNTINLQRLTGIAAIEAVSNYR